MLGEYFKIAVKNLRLRPLRSWLTILGIVMGIFLVVSLFSLSEGLKESVMRELRAMGGDLIFVMPGEDLLSGVIGGLEFSDADVRAVERTMGVETVVIMPWGMEVIRHGGEAKTALIMGVSLDRAVRILREDMGWETTQGNFPRPGRREVLVGSLVPARIFPGMEVGDEIIVKGRRFTVSGILRSIGNQNDDSMITMDLDDFRSVTGKREGTPMILAKMRPGFEVDEVSENIRSSLEETRKRRVGEDSAPFTVMSSETVSDMVGSIMGILQIAVFAFASIAIIVGGIGIMNTMYTSVKERTKEIGILKAIGAKRSHINLIFLFEAGIIGLLGGAGGVLFGIILSKGVEVVLYQATGVFYLQAHISPLLVIFGLSFSFLIGCASGFFPARKAAGMTPVDALRYE